jgi:hypothetical protein
MVAPSVSSDADAVAGVGASVPVRTMIKMAQLGRKVWWLDHGSERDLGFVSDTAPRGDSHECHREPRRRQPRRRRRHL